MALFTEEESDDVKFVDDTGEVEATLRITDCGVTSDVKWCDFDYSDAINSDATVRLNVGETKFLTGNSTDYSFKLEDSPGELSAHVEILKIVR